MIRQNTYNTAIGVAATFAGQGKTLVASPGSLLSELVSLSTPCVSQLQSASGANPVEMFGYQLTHETDDVSGPSQHSLSLGKSIDDLAPLVANHIAFAKDTVKPLVVELANLLEQRKQELKSSAPGADIKIEVATIPSLLKDDSFLDNLSFYKGATPVPPKGALKLGIRTSEEVAALMTTGQQRVDELIVQWLSTMPPEFPAVVWNSYFELANGQDTPGIPYSAMHETAFGKVNMALGTYLVARRILEDVQASDMSLAAYKNLVTDVRDFAGATLVIQLRSIYTAIEAKTLVLFGSSRQKLVIVNGEIYTDWLNAGGKPEILLGMVVSNNISTSQAMIEEKSEAHLRSWNNYLLYETTRNNNLFFQRYQLAIVEAFVAQLVNITDAEKEMNLRTADRYDNIIKNAGDYIAMLTDKQQEESFEMALQLVARIRFCHTSSFQILDSINQASKANPNIDVREAALFAAADYLGDWLGDMVAVK